MADFETVMRRLIVIRREAQAHLRRQDYRAAATAILQEGAILEELAVAIQELSSKGATPKRRRLRENASVLN